MGKIRRKTRVHEKAPSLKKTPEVERPQLELSSLGDASMNWEPPKLDLIPGLPQSKPLGPVSDKYMVKGASTLNLANFAKPADTLPLDISNSNYNDDEPEPLKKLDKRKKRHTAFLKKLHAGHELRKKEKEKARKKANPPVIVGDLTELQDALQDAATQETTSPKKNKNNKDKVQQLNKRVKSKKGRSRALESEAANFKSVLSDQKFKTNPTAAITEHLRNAIKNQVPKQGASNKLAAIVNPKNAKKNKTKQQVQKKVIIGKIGKGGRLRRGSKKNRKDK
eukprot:m.60593 g.60593  ORF g.60593 m.60593 type:complete len:280 (+) comp11334_c0_seq3:267-1106(+)